MSNAANKSRRFVVASAARTSAAIVILAAAAGSLSAHGGEAHERGPEWTFDPWIVVPIALAGGLYAAGALKLLERSSDRRFLIRSGAAFCSGWLALVVALVSPVHFLGEHLFTVHMIEHELVMAVSAPLIVLARPVGVMFWGLPRPLRHAAGKAFKSVVAEKVWSFATGGFVATMLHGAAIWAWHAPALFDATVTDLSLHRLQHLSFFATAIFFWWAVIWRLGRGMAAWHLFATMMHTSILGALIALAPHVAYVAQTQSAPEWGLTPLEDQQLAGIVMWVPGGIIYAAAALAVLALWITDSGAGGVHADRVRTP